MEVFVDFFFIYIGFSLFLGIGNTHNNMKHYIYCLIAILFFNTLKAQEQCTITHYSTENGLSQKTVMSMLQDRKGRMWFATWDGINKFDGTGFTTYKTRPGDNYTLNNSRADEIEEDAYGFIWMRAYDNRAYRFDPATEVFTPVVVQDHPSVNVIDIVTLPSGSVWLLTERDGAMRVLTDPNTLQFTVQAYPSMSRSISTSRIFKIYEDRDRNEWMLSNNGLGLLVPGETQPRIYFVEKKIESAKSLQAFYDVEEQDDALWFASDNGRVWRYNKSDATFELHELPTSSLICDICILSPESMFVATADDGFFLYNPETRRSEAFRTSLRPELKSDVVKDVFVDSRKEIWINQNEATTVTHFVPATKRIKRESVPVEQGNAARSNPGFMIQEDINGYLWVHPMGGGLSYYNRDADRLCPFYNEARSVDQRFSNKLHSMYSDRQGNLWMCTHSDGIEKVTFLNSHFHLLSPNQLEYKSLQDDVRALFEDADKNLWVGMKNGDLRVYDEQLNYLGYLTESGTIARSGQKMRGVAYCVEQDKSGVIWIATKGDGLLRLEKRNRLSYQVQRFRYKKDDMYSLSDDNLYDLYFDSHDRLWIATFGGGLNYMERDKAGKYIFISHRNHLKNYPIEDCHRSRVVSPDGNGRIWVGTTAGALMFDENFSTPEQIEFHRFLRKPKDINSLSNNDVHCIYYSKNGELYLGTFGGGLNRLNGIDEAGNASFEVYTVNEGLPSDVVLSIQEDAQHNIWVSTENGLSEFIREKEKFVNYDDRSFAFPFYFNESASCTAASGRQFWGGDGGILYFTPDSIVKSDYCPPILFTRLLLSNEVVPIGENSLLQKSLDDISRLVIPSDERWVTIQYASLDLRNPQNIQYAYMMDGFDATWQYVDKQQAAIYTNLPKGEYTFRVKSTNSDGVWVDNERTLSVKMLPTFWETPLAYLLYVLFFLLLVGVVAYILFTIYRLKNEVVVEQQVSDIKLRFFTNISHELRTPLTLISGPVEHLLMDKTLSEDNREQLLLVEKNTDRMLRLVNQILDFRKIQNKKMKLNVQRVDVIPFIRQTMSNFSSLAEEHQMHYTLQTDLTSCRLWLDKDKLDTIIFNLLSNAFKYTPQGKNITVVVEDRGDRVVIGVCDEGIGIAESKRSVLFVRFENMIDKNIFNQPTSGIGLSLVKELVDMHHGTIEVDSKLGRGSSFWVSFLKGREHYGEDTNFILEDAVDEELIEDNGEEDGILNESGKRTILVVEDNKELRFFLRKLFAQNFNVVEAADGAEGFAQAQKYIPDLIISDVMMPGTDGIEMAKQLRANMATSHIPLILLTAKATIENKLEGLELGVDDYITKPFSAAYLEARVENLLSQRDKLRSIYCEHLLADEPEEEMTEAPDISPNDRKFMDRLLELMEKNMDNGDLVVDDFVREMAVSRSVFFKKLKVLTGLAPIEFIKEMRIKRAASYIESGEYNMTQIAYMVGINDPRYFSKCFKQRYNMTPTEYKEMKTKRK